MLQILQITNLILWENKLKKWLFKKKMGANTSIIQTFPLKLFKKYYNVHPMPHRIKVWLACTNIYRHFFISSSNYKTHHVICELSNTFFSVKMQYCQIYRIMAFRLNQNSRRYIISINSNFIPILIFWKFGAKLV